MSRKRRKKKLRTSPLKNTLPAKYRSHPFMLTRWMTDIDNFARRKKRKKPRALRHPPIQKGSTK